MLKAMIHGPGDLRLDEVPDPVPDAGQVVVRTVRASMCHTDVKRFLGIPGASYPEGLGHDAAGVVESLGPGVTGHRVGDRVGIDQWTGCGECSNCRRSRPHLCLAGPRIRPAWFAERFICGANQLVPLPDAVSFDDAAFLEPVYTATNTRGLLGYDAGDVVVVVGAGSMGWGQVQIAAATGATVVAVDLIERRLEMAERFGASHLLKADDPAIAEKLRSIAGPGGPLYVIETTGVKPGIELALDIAGPGAKIAALTTIPPDNFRTFVMNELELIGIKHGYEKRRRSPSSPKARPACRRPSRIAILLTDFPKRSASRPTTTTSLRKR